MTNPVDEDIKTEQWTYLGERPGASVAKVYSYRRPDGTKLSFKKALTRYGSVGHLYNVSFVEDDKSVFLRGTPEFTSDRAEDYNDLVMAQRVSASKIAADQLERNAKRQSDIDEALEPLIEIAKTLRATAHREALIKYVERAIWRA